VVLKVLIAIHGFPPTHYAGSERAAERIALWLVAQGIHVEVFTCENLYDPNTHVETRTENGIIIHRLNYDIKNGDYFQNLYDDPRIGAAFQQVVGQGDFDVVHVVSGYLVGPQIIRIAKAHNIPVVITLTEFWFMCYRLNLLNAHTEMCVGPETDEKCTRCIAEEKRRYRLASQNLPALSDAFWKVANSTFARDDVLAVKNRRETLSESLKQVDLVICPSRFIISKFAEFGYDTSRFVQVRHGLKPPPTSIPVRDYSRVSAGLTLGYTGQIKPHKGIDLLVDAAIDLLNQGYQLTLNLWGDSEGKKAYAEALQEKTKPYPSIRWRGKYGQDQLPDVLAELDALVVPSRWYENSPSVILEAHTYGMPVITTNLGGMKELVQHEVNGLLFEVNDSKDLQSQIKRMLDDPALLARLAAGIPAMPTVDDELGSIFKYYQQLTQPT